MVADPNDRTATCQAWVAVRGGSRKCTRKATHLMPDGSKGVCRQHARTYDVPKHSTTNGGDNG